MIRIAFPRFYQISNRSGITLLETLIVISASAVLLSLIGVWTFKLLQFSISVRQRHSDQISIDRLATDFRRDVRWAQDLNLTDSHQLELQMTGGDLISYQLINDRYGSSVHVQRKNGDQIQGQEEYRFSDQRWLAWESSELPDWISLVVYRRANVNIPANWSDGKISSTAKPAPLITSDEPLGDADTASTGTESIGPIDLQVRVGPRRWSGWEIVHEP